MNFIQVFAVAALAFSPIIAYKVRRLSSPKSNIADGAHWDPKSQSLYYCDLGVNGSENTLLRYDYKRDRTYTASIVNRNGFASFIIPLKCKKNHFAVGVGRSIEIIKWDGCSRQAKVVRTVVNVEPGREYSTNTLNDAKADPRGRFFGGTERALFCKDDSRVANASFYRYTKRDGLLRLRSDVYSSNGLTWNTCKKKFYYIDSCKFDIKEYDYDKKTGNIYNERIAYDFRINGQFAGYTADGMTIDRDGFLWVALFKGNSVVQIDPERHLIIRNITIPAHQVTAAVFGGPKLNELFVTTGGKAFDIQIGEGDTIQEPASSGYLYKVTGLKSRGYAPYKLSCL